MKKNALWKEYVKAVFKNEEDKVISFLKNEFEEGLTFRTETQFLNKVEALLKSYCSSFKADNQDTGFWHNRRKHLERYKRNVKNILSVMAEVQREKMILGIPDASLEEVKEFIKKKNAELKNLTPNYEGITDDMVLEEAYLEEQMQQTRDSWL